MSSDNDKGYDPKLKLAMEQVKMIMIKHDIGGFVTLVSKTHSEFLLSISPTWSCAFFEKGNDKVRFKATVAEYGSKEARNKAIALTIHLIVHMKDLAARAFSFGDQLEKLLSQHVEIVKDPGVFRPHQEGDV